MDVVVLASGTRQVRARMVAMGQGLELEWGGKMSVYV